MAAWKNSAQDGARSRARVVWCLALVLLPVTSGASEHPGVWDDASANRGLLATASSQLCTSQEYYCTDASVYMDTAFAQATSGNCTTDSGTYCWLLGSLATTHATHSSPAAELGLVFCEGLVIPEASYKALQQERSACVADCTQSSTALALPLQYYWNASTWQPCPVLCDGGFQTRDVACINSVDNRCTCMAAEITGCTACWLHARAALQPTCVQLGGRLPVRGSSQASSPQGLWLDPLPSGFGRAHPAAGALGRL